MLTNTEYGFLVSVAGAGIIAGACLNTVIVERSAYLSDAWCGEFVCGFWILDLCFFKHIDCRNDWLFVLAFF